MIRVMLPLTVTGCVIVCFFFTLVVVMMVSVVADCFVLQITVICVYQLAIIIAN